MLNTTKKKYIINEIPKTSPILGCAVGRLVTANLQVVFSSEEIQQLNNSKDKSTMKLNEAWLSSCIVLCSNKTCTNDTS